MKLSGIQRGWFFGALCCVFLAALAAVLADALLTQWNPGVDLSGLGVDPALSERAQAVLSDTSGTVSATCVLPTESPAALPTGRLLRALAQASRSVAGATLEVAYVDPRVEVAAAAQLMAQGAEGPGVLLRRSGRDVFVPERALLDDEGVYDPAEAEGALVAALARLSRADGVTVGWLTGHGEPRFDGTDPQTGFSGLRRTLENEGFRIRELALDAASPDASIPEDLGTLVIMGPRYPVTAPERALLSDWLDRGGRLFLALPASGDAGLGPLLERWGIHAGTQPRRPVRRTEGGAGLTDELSAEHPVTRELVTHAQLTFVAPRALVTESVPHGIAVTPLVKMRVRSLPDAGVRTNETVSVMIAAERGGTAGSDLAFRPGRVVVAGGTAFAENRYVLNHASANRDLLSNVFRWLTGLSGSGARGGAGVLRVGQDERAWRADFLTVALGVPLVLCAGLWLLSRRRP